MKSKIKSRPPLEGKYLVRETKRFASETPWQSWWALLSTLTLFIGAIAITCTGWPWPVRLGGSLLVALLHIRLFVIYHDYEHGAIFRGSWLARWLVKPYGFLALTPPSVWKDTHDHHHRNNCKEFGVDTIGSYPVMSVEDYRKAPLQRRIFYVVSRHPLTIALGYFTVFLYGFCLQPLWRSPRQHIDSAVAIALHLGLIAFLALTRPDLLLLTLILPIFLSSAFGSYLFYAQHNFPEVKLRPGEEWDYATAALRSSSYIRMHPILHWFTANIGYHHIHHLNARIPFYRLPEAMAALEELQSPGTTSLAPREVRRCLRLKLWDVAKDRFVSFAEARRGSADPVEEADPQPVGACP